MQSNKKTKKRPSPYLRTAKKNIDKQSSFIRTLNLMFIIFIGVLLSIFILADNKTFLENTFGNDSPITKLFVKLAKTKDKKDRATFGFPFGLKRQNILFLGIDSNGDGADDWKGTRSDTIILVNIDPRTRSVNAISIPRDSKVYLPNDKGINKINSAHALGGIKMVKTTIEDTLGVKIDKYIIVHDKAVSKVVEALGGVNIYVEKNMKYDDYAGKLHINLKKGDNRLSPQEAVGYLRFRHDALGDIGRTQRQQWFLRGLMAELQKPENIVKIPEIVSVAKQYVKTDMSLYEMSQYAAIVKTLDMNKMEIATLPGSPNLKGSTSYWILDPQKTQEVVNRLIYRDKVALDETQHFTASVMYSKDKEKAAEQLIVELKTLNVDVKCKGSAERRHSQFVAHSNKVTNDYYNWLKKKTNESDLDHLQFVYEPMNFYCTDTDFTVVLSGK